jgi:predicted ATP-grasp superfamily ATP-dependent carboligase
MQRETILITGARAPIALELARSFARAGCRVLMADTLHFTIARWSNAVDKYYILPSPRFKKQDFANAIQKIVQNEKVTHLIPTCEEAFYVALFKNQWSCKVWTSDFALMNQLHNKLTFFQNFAKYLQIPDTQLVSNFKDWENTENYVFKRVYSRFASATIIQKKVAQNDFLGEKANQWIAQKFVKGKEICVYSIWDAGKMKAFACYHPLYRAGKGAGIFFEPVQHPKIQQMVQHFGTHIQYSGQLSFDVIVDDENIFFIECNPRGTSGGHLIHQFLADAFLNQKPIFQPDDTNYAIKYLMLMLQCPSFLNLKVLRSQDVIIQKNDLLPFLLQPLGLFEIIFNKFSKNLSWLEATTYDIEWNG